MTTVVADPRQLRESMARSIHRLEASEFFQRRALNPGAVVARLRGIVERVPDSQLDTRLLSAVQAKVAEFLEGVLAAEVEAIRRETAEPATVRAGGAPSTRPRRKLLVSRGG